MPANQSTPEVTRVELIAWRCFHCGDVFTDESCARLHFGRDEDSQPACIIKAGAEQGLLGALRAAEYEAADARRAIADECTDAARAHYAQATRHDKALRNAEELGYERGLADGRALPPARGGDELREALVLLRDDAADPYSFYGDEDEAGYSITQHKYFQWGEDCVIAIGERNLTNHWDDEAFDAKVAVLQAALASTDMAGALPADVRRLVITARRVTDSDGGRSELSFLLDAVEAFSSRVPYEDEPDDMPAAPPVEGLTSGEGRSDADLLRLIAKDHARLAPNAYHSAETLVQIADRLDAPKATATASVREAIRAEIINTPETADFMAGVPLEAAHQRERWGVSHDGGKTPFDWFWLIGYLAQKAASAQVAGDAEKALHHTISTAAALANWHAQITGRTDMRPGIGPDNGGEKPGSAYSLAATLTDSGTAATIGGERA